MDYSQLSLAELKKLAKGRRIKLYYTKPKKELQWLLSQKDIPINYKIEKFTIKELREQAKERNIRGFWPLSRGALMSLLYPDFAGVKQDDQNSQNSGDENPTETENHEQVGV